MNTIDFKNGSKIIGLNNSNNIRNKRSDEQIGKLVEKYMMEKMNKAFMNFDSNVLTSTSATSFTKEEFEKSMKILKDIPPIVVEIEVYKSVWYKLKEYIPETDTNLLGYIDVPRIDGIRIIAIPESDDFNENQAKLIYNDGTENSLIYLRMIINMYNLNIKEYNYISIIRDKENNMAKIYFNEQLLQEDNFWDFEPSIGSFVASLKRAVDSCGCTYEVVRNVYTYNI